MMTPSATAAAVHTNKVGRNNKNINGNKTKETTTKQAAATTPTMTYEAYYCEQRQREFYYNPASQTVQWHAPNVSLLAIQEDDDHDDDHDDGASRDGDYGNANGVADLFQTQQDVVDHDNDNDDNAWNGPQHRLERRRKLFLLLGLLFLPNLLLLSIIQISGRFYGSSSSTMPLAQRAPSSSPGRYDHKRDMVIPGVLPPINPQQQQVRKKSNPSNRNQEPIPARHAPDDDTKEGTVDPLPQVTTGAQPIAPPRQQLKTATTTLVADVDTLQSIPNDSDDDTTAAPTIQSIWQGMYECIPESLWKHDVVLPVELTRELGRKQHLYHTDDTAAATRSLLERIQFAAQQPDSEYYTNDNDNDNNHPNQLCKIPWARRLLGQQCSSTTTTTTATTVQDHLDHEQQLDDILYME